MSLAPSQRRDQRRRLVLSWNRAGSTSSPPAAESRTLADYAADALPERQPALAMLVPTGLGGLTLVAAGLLSLMAASTGVCLWETITDGRLFGAGEGRFAPTIAAVRACLDVRTFSSLAGWLSQACLTIAIAAALVVRLMRRHRRDDYRGRYRAWGWLAGLFTVSACAAQAPIGTVVGSLLSDATGVSIGAGGVGWWVLAGIMAYSGIGLWAVLPLHERAATVAWLSLCLGAWAVAGACSWVGRGHDLWLVVGNTSWSIGAACAAIAMLAAARSVIREVRGLPSRQPTRKQAAVTAEASSKKPLASAAADHVASQTAARQGRDDVDGPPRQLTSYVDGSEAEDEGEDGGRHLSKAERKRLRKLARMNRAA